MPTLSRQRRSCFAIASVMGHIRFGLAAGCEARLAAPERCPLHVWAMPVVRPLAQSG
jgi:hypothetical protein